MFYSQEVEEMKVFLIRILVVLFILSLACVNKNPSTSSDEKVYLHSNFREPNGIGGLKFEYSKDLYNWQKVPGVIFEPSVGTEFKNQDHSFKIMRDAFVAPDPQNAGFHLIWTSGWDRKDIGYAHSTDLIHWTDEKLIPVMKDKPAENCWAPKLFFDNQESQWIVYWSTTLSDNTFPRDDDPTTTRNHRIWYVTTRDFQSFSEPQVLFNPYHSCIDAFILKTNDKYCLFFKDERGNDAVEYHPGYQNIRMAESNSPYGSYTNISETITGNGPGSGKWQNEGPCAIQKSDSVFVYYDHHGSQPYYGAVVSTDLKNWQDISEKLNFPKGAKHGHVFSVDPKIVENLLNRN